METINLIRNLITELDQAKTKINKLKTKLSMKELDIMNLKKDNIRLIMDLEQYKLDVKNSQELDDLYVENEEVEEIVIPNVQVKYNDINSQKITDSLLLNRKNKLKRVEKTNIPKKESSGISKSIILNQRNKLKNIVLTERLPALPISKSNDDVLAAAILAIGKRYRGDIDNTLTDSWI